MKFVGGVSAGMNIAGAGLGSGSVAFVGCRGGTCMAFYLACNATLVYLYVTTNRYYIKKYLPSKYCRTDRL